METIETTVLQRESEMARTLLILNNYEWIKAEAAAIGIEVVPLKGIDLLLTVYADTLDRQVRDIDILCHTESDCRRLAERLCQEEYRLEFPFSLRHEALTAKQKVSLLSCSTTKVNVDIHIAFVTKKFFAQTIGCYNADALERCRDGHMEPLDRWLFLAQHAAFHVFADKKWTQDLQVLYSCFTPEQRVTLRQRASQYGFLRVMDAALYHLHSHFPVADSEMTIPDSHFLRFVTHFDRPFDRRPFDRLIASYWEFAFIQKRSQRCLAWLRLMMPSRGMLTNIYRIRRPAALLLFYPLNIFISGFTSLLFWTVYFLTVTFCRPSGGHQQQLS